MAAWLHVTPGMDTKPEKCAHPACICSRTKDSKYCSAYCKAAADTTELTCNCGHAGCGTEAVLTAQS
jgi:hypothetical protein